jgi:hypothetical protein
MKGSSEYSKNDFILRSIPKSFMNDQIKLIKKHKLTFEEGDFKDGNNLKIFGSVAQLKKLLKDDGVNSTDIKKYF